MFYIVFWVFVSLGLMKFVLSGELTVEPINLIAVAGQQAVFSCSTQSQESLSWRRQQVGRSLFSNPISAEDQNGLRTVQVDDDGNGRGRLNVVLNAVQPDDAGSYRCRGNRTGDEADCQLVVLDAVPNCTTELLGDLDLTARDQHLLMRCAFHWSSNFNQDMPWFDPAGHKFLDTRLSAAVGQTPLHRRTVVARPRPTGNNDDRTRLFELSIAVERVEPGYIFNWSTVNLDVSMSVRNAHIRANSTVPSAGEENVLHVGDELICEADGSYDVQYLWEEVFPAQTSPLHSSHHPQQLSVRGCGTHVYRCTVSHQIRGVNYNDSANITVRVVVAGHEYRTTLAMPGPVRQPAPATATITGDGAHTGSVILVVVLSAVVFVLIVLGVMYQRRRASTSSRRDSAVLPAAGPTEVPLLEQPVPRRCTPPPTENVRCSVSHDTYEDVDREVHHPVTQDPSDVEELPRSDDPPHDNDQATPGSEICLQSQPGANTTPKAFFEPVMIDLRSSEGQPPNNYLMIGLLDVYPRFNGSSKDNPAAVNLCCGDVVLLRSGSD